MNRYGSDDYRLDQERRQQGTRSYLARDDRYGDRFGGDGRQGRPFTSQDSPQVENRYNEYEGFQPAPNNFRPFDRNDYDRDYQSYGSEMGDYNSFNASFPSNPSVSRHAQSFAGQGSFRHWNTEPGPFGIPSIRERSLRSYEAAQGRGQFRGVGPKGYSRSKDRIIEDINDALTESSELDASGIEVNFQDGEVSLTGSVSSREAKRHAQEIAEQVRGVKDVHNNLRISKRREDYLASGGEDN